MASLRGAAERSERAGSCSRDGTAVEFGLPTGSQLRLGQGAEGLFGPPGEYQPMGDEDRRFDRRLDLAGPDGLGTEGDKWQCRLGVKAPAGGPSPA